MMRVLKYNEAKLKITQLIQQNSLQPGDKLMTERELASQLGMSIISVRRALADFEEAGIIQKVAGVGSFYQGNLTSVRCSGQVALVNIGDFRYPDSLSQGLFEKALSHYQATQKIFHVQRDVQPEILSQLCDFDKIAVTGFLTPSWLECLKSLGKPMLQIGETELVNNLSKVKPDWHDAIEVVLRRFAGVNRAHCAFLLPDVSTYTCGNCLRDAVYSKIEAEGGAVNASLITYVSPRRMINTINDFLLAHADEIELLVLEHSSLLPLLMAPESSRITRRVPIVVMHEVMDLPPDVTTLPNYYPLTFEENILVRVAELFYTMPCSFFAERKTDYIKAKLLEPSNQ